jgi:hypothetical protein
MGVYFADTGSEPPLLQATRATVGAGPGSTRVPDHSDHGYSRASCGPKCPMLRNNASGPKIRLPGPISVGFH